jgi:hypothetical protein
MRQTVRHLRVAGKPKAVTDVDVSVDVHPTWYEVLRRLREAHGITQEVWAELLGYGRRTAQRWEQGIHTPDARQVTAIVAFCDEHGIFGRSQIQRLKRSSGETYMPVRAAASAWRTV